VPTLNLAEWSLDASLFEGDKVAGPVPSLFAEDTVASLEAIANNPSKAYGDYQKLMRSFFMPENIELEETAALLKKPRYIVNLILI